MVKRDNVMLTFISFDDILLSNCWLVPVEGLLEVFLGLLENIV